MKKLGPALVAVAVFSLVGGTAHATHPRPEGATPITSSLVPAYKQCVAPTRTHGAPLAFPSCTPPAQTSSSLTVGTPDANGARVNSVGRARFDTVMGAPGPPQDSDIFTAVRFTDVRCKAGVDSAVCNGFNEVDGPEYWGQIQVTIISRITDPYNGPSLTEAATMVDIPFPVNTPCGNTTDFTVGGTCSVATTFNAIVPGAIKDTTRTTWEVGQIQVSDGGPDGNAITAD